MSANPCHRCGHWCGTNPVPWHMCGWCGHNHVGRGYDPVEDDIEGDDA